MHLWFLGDYIERSNWTPPPPKKRERSKPPPKHKCNAECCLFINNFHIPKLKERGRSGSYHRAMRDRVVSLSNMILQYWQKRSLWLTSIYLNPNLSGLVDTIKSVVSLKARPERSAYHNPSLLYRHDGQTVRNPKRPGGAELGWTVKCIHVYIITTTAV